MAGKTFPKNTPNKGVKHQIGRPGMAHNGIGPLTAPNAKDPIDKYKGKYGGPGKKNNGIGPVIMK